MSCNLTTLVLSSVHMSAPFATNRTSAKPTFKHIGGRISRALLDRSCARSLVVATDFGPRNTFACTLSCTEGRNRSK